LWPVIARYFRLHFLSTFVLHSSGRWKNKQSFVVVTGWHAWGAVGVAQGNIYRAFRWQVCATSQQCWIYALCVGICFIYVLWVACRQRAIFVLLTFVTRCFSSM
jgi:hypothetical protein